jgi:hypothetical protein
MPVAEDLYFHVARSADVALEKDVVVSKLGYGFPASLLEPRREIGRLVDHSHAATAAAECRFND